MYVNCGLDLKLEIMKRNIQHIISFLFVVGALFSFTSCLDDDWFYDDWYEDGGWQDDRRVESIIRGRWFVDFVKVSDDRCPYYESDEFNFYSNGGVEIFGDGDFYESGHWWVDGHYLLIDFDGDHRADWEGYIERLYRGLLAVNVKDYD